MTHPKDESEMQMVLRHIRQGRQSLRRQRAVVESLIAKGLPFAEAKRSLRLFEDMQQEHIDHLERLLVRAETSAKEWSSRTQPWL